MADTEGRTDRMVASVAHVFSWFRDGSWERHHLDPGVADFTFGNPQELPLPGLVDALQRNAVPQRQGLVRLQDERGGAARRRRRVAPAAHGHRLRGRGRRAHDRGLRRARGHDPRAVRRRRRGDLPLAALVLLRADDRLGGRHRRPRVDLADGTFDLDVDAIAAAITPRTRAIIVNTPHNPTGRIYREPELHALGDALRAASDRNGRPIVLISDEAYNRIVFDGIDFRTPALDYDATATIYTYGKTTLAPGQRIGFVALHPSFPDKQTVGYRIFVHQLGAGWGFPNALLQHSIRDLETLSIDVPALQARRDRMVPALREMGYEVTRPEGTFYLMVRSPDPDDLAFTDRLAELGALVLPGTIVERPGWFRVSLTASDEMVERGLEAFRAALEGVTARA